ncbi:hypothetical protein [Leptospira jelokensis]|uniref:hypothetical protein n=1 Tax=Leptospira jelokensis TaxID=2484931 RepID=UPI00109108A4|nr:hypothetical protein [Leptospira jelokensis]TGL97958.1 hypothetical protein EHQ79_19110 [Leptospira jelokensis]
MMSETNQSNLVEILTMSPVRPFPDDPVAISRILAYLGKDQATIAYEAGVSRPVVSEFITNKCHSPKVAFWFEKHDIYLDRDYPDPTKAIRTLERVSA